MAEVGFGRGGEAQWVLVAVTNGLGGAGGRGEEEAVGIGGRGGAAAARMGCNGAASGEGDAAATNLTFILHLSCGVVAVLSSSSSPSSIPAACA
jgi:hypothetical protein